MITKRRYLRCGIAAMVLCWWFLLPSLKPSNDTSKHPAINDKFLTYSPHSGLHNQRIAIINAMTIAKALNRTLIMPPLNLGSGAGWKPTHVLRRQLGKCPHISVYKRRMQGCPLYNDYAPTDVNQIFNVSFAEKLGVRVIQRSDMRKRYFKDMWGVTEGDENFLMPEDSFRYSYQIYDSRDTDTNLMSFLYRQDLDVFKDRPEPFLVFGSMFGSTRLMLSQPENLQLNRDLRFNFAISHPTVLEIANKIVDHLGGPANFTSLHVRTGYNFGTVESNTDMIKKSLLHNFHKNTKKDNALALRIRKIQKMSMRLKACRAYQGENGSSHPRLQMIYLATTTSKPRTKFPELYHNFPCIFSAADFQNELKVINSKKSRNMLLPLVEAEVASKANNFIGNSRSTFSNYIKHRNEFFLGKS